MIKKFEDNDIEKKMFVEYWKIVAGGWVIHDAESYKQGLGNKLEIFCKQFESVSLSAIIADVLWSEQMIKLKNGYTTDPIKKGDDIWTGLSDFWKICQKYWIPEDTNEYWDKFIADASIYYDSHKDIFIRALIYAIIDDCENRLRHRTYNAKKGWRE